MTLRDIINETPEYWEWYSRPYEEWSLLRKVATALFTVVAAMLCCIEEVAL